ncbi:hypothetical protein PIROE2DRAFT_12457, partial [Piromyces sp. E2]
MHHRINIFDDVSANINKKDKREYFIEEYIVNTPDDFANVVSSLSGNLTIIVDGNLESLKKEIKIKPPNNYGLLKIKGTNRKTSALRFIAGTIGLTFEDLDSVEIENITFRGRLNFKNIGKVNIHDIDHIGLFDTSGTQEGGYVSIKNYNFTSNDGKSRENSVKFSAGGSTFIEDSIFTASIGCTDSIIKYNGKDCNVTDFTVKNCSFNSKHFANAMIIQNSKFTLESSQFYNGYNSLNSAFLTVRESYSKINNCTFKDGYSLTEGGVFNTYNNQYFEASNIKVYNTTSFNGGGLYYEDSKFPDNISILRNIEYINYWKYYPVNGLGSIINLYTDSNIIVENLYAEGFYCTVITCSLFTITDNARIVIKDSRINKVHSIENGIIFYLTSEINERSYIKAINCTFSNIEINTSKDASIIWAEGGDIELENVHFYNIESEYSSLIYALKKGTVSLKNVEFENVYNEHQYNAIFVKTQGNIMTDNVYFKNILYRGAFIRSDDIDITLDKITLENYNICVNSKDIKCVYEQNSFINDPETVFLRVDNKANLTITNSNIKNFDLYTLFIYGQKSFISIDNLNVDKGHFVTGAVSLSDVKPYRLGNIKIKNSEFNNINSDYGPIINVDYLSNPQKNTILFDNTIFQNIEAHVYRRSHVCHAFSKNSEPVINNKDDIIQSLGSLSFTTNPIKLIITDDSTKKFFILSGETLSDNIKFQLIDDYNRTIRLDSNINKMNLNDFIFFKIRVEDDKNLAVLGQVNGYCWDDSCITGNIKVVGNPGTYPIYMELITY